MDSLESSRPFPFPPPQKSTISSLNDYRSNSKPQPTVGNSNAARTRSPILPCPPTTLHILTIHARGPGLHHVGRAAAASVEVDVFQIKSVNVAREIALWFLPFLVRLWSLSWKGGRPWRREKEGKEGRRRKTEGVIYPSTVKQILIRRSAPQPAIRKTPTGGTVGVVNIGVRSLFDM